MARLLAPLVPTDDSPDEPDVSRRYPYAIPRATQDRPDERDGALLHAVYLVPSDSPEEQLDEFGVLEDSVRSMNVWFRQQSQGLRWRLDVFSFEWDDPATEEVERITVEALDVTFIKSTRPGSELDGAFEVRDELRALGLNEADKRYLSYVASGTGGICGDGIYTISSDPNARPDGKYAQVYLDSAPGCRAREFAPDPNTPSFTETIAQHEVLHNESIASLIAPHHCWGPFYLHICTPPLVLSGLDPERRDLMFPFAGPPLTDQVLDRDHDDYFAHPFPYRDLDESVYLERAA